MPNVASLLGHKVDKRSYASSNQLVSNSLVGIEIELEEIGRNPPTIEGWEAVAEGSLRRRGLEYRLREPLFGRDLITALENMEQRVANYIDFTGVSNILDENTSVHVHIDCRDLDTVQLANFVLLSILFEQILFEFAAPERENNIFSLSLARAEREIKSAADVIQSLLDDPEQLHRHTGRSSKYASINLAALAEFGSIEFRAHRGEYRATPLLQWVNVLLSLKNAAVKGTVTPENYSELIHTQSPATFIRNIFGEYTKLFKRV